MTTAAAPVFRFLKWRYSATSGILLLTLSGGAALAQAAAAPPAVAVDALKKGFEEPPQSARPLVWWHWMNGNISKEGIKLDLEWMHRVGIGGFQNFDAALATPLVVDKRLAYMTPEWKDAFKYATTLADQLGMEEAIAGSPGWSESGGPWVTGTEAMKKYVWSETMVEGGKPFTGTLNHPPSTTGPFQNLPITSNAFTEPEFYSDSTVVAYRMPAVPMPEPNITWSGGKIDTALLADGDLTKPTYLPRAAAAGDKAWIQYDFVEPQRICALTIVRLPAGAGDDYFARGGNPDSGEALEASDDGASFRVVAALPKGGSMEHTVAFAPVTARYFRVTFTTMPKPAGVTKSPADIALSELTLHSDARVNRFEEKAAFNQMPDLYGFATPAVASSDAIRKSDVIDLTSKFQLNGTLDWTPPPGKWVVLRIGYSLLGITNHPATKEATGLEVDKLNANYVKDYMDRYLDSYKETVGADLMGKRGIRYVINDSWEAGAQNWTDDMVADFTRLRGYDPHPWLPVLTGRVVESAEASDRFLWDLRKTIADLTATEHYGQLESTLKERGMGHYGESHEGGRAFIADGMEVKKLNDIPMSAMWVQAPGVNKELYGYDADDRESASVAHIYGQNLAAAESMTARINSAWAWSPATLKPTADQELVNGINRFVIHESAHQPLVDLGKAPGLTLGPYGQWFNRNETWAEQAGPWIDYLARSSYMLQQGHFAADVLYYYGEDSNLTAIFANSAPNLPEGYGFDYINADGLIHMFKAVSGRIATASGMSYRLLVLDPYSKHMSLPVLRAIHTLVEQGAIVCGAKPTDTPSLADDQAEFNRLSDQLFGSGSGVVTFGKGKVFAGMDAAATLKALKVDPDFDHTKPEADTRVAFVHRRLGDGDIYLLDNRNDRDETIDATFRVTGKSPELWHAETGKSEAVSYKIVNGHTTVPLHLEPWGTVFVVFRNPATAATLTVPAPVETQLATVDGPWTVSFQPDRGAPDSITLDKLASWSESADTGVKYFSGTATYTTAIQAQGPWFKPGASLWIDLGDVKNLASVEVNGFPLGIVWHAPNRVDVTQILRPGTNQVIVRVTNAWVNRLIGDQQPEATKYTFADIAPYTAKSPLQPSGLLGPVVVLQEAAQ